MNEWEIAFIEQKNLPLKILQDIEMGVCPREVADKLAVFSYELRQACFGDHYITSKVQNAYKNSEAFEGIQEKIKKIERYRMIFREKAKQWFDFLQKNNFKKGNVYILSNRYMPGLLKIGYTEKYSIYERKDELYYQGRSGVPYPFKVEFAKYTVCPDKAEDIIHDRLLDYRVNPDREFFKIKVTKAMNVVTQVISETEMILVQHFNKTFFNNLKS